MDFAFAELSPVSEPSLVFAENAWLGPRQFARRVLVGFGGMVDTVARDVSDAQIPPRAQRVDWLVPGFVNAHCHLEYSWLRNAALPRGTVPFGQWMRAIISCRPQSDEDLQRRADAMAAGAQELLAGGCTAIVDSSTDGSSAKFLAGAGLKYHVLYEVLGLSRERAEPMLARALELTARNTNAGLNPHAPYSVGEWLRGALKGIADAVPQAWHIAETADEEELFLRGNGSVAEFLEQFGMQKPWGSGSAPEKSSFQFLADAGVLNRCVLAFHGNRLDAREASFFSAPRGLVHCPATHRWFQRAAVPLKQWLQDGVNVCLGTDSLASGETLSMLAMARMAVQDNADLSANDVLEMACTNPRKLALWSLPPEKAETGAQGIAVGCAADLVAISNPALHLLPDGDVDVAWRELLADQRSEVAATWVTGQMRYCSARP